MALNIDDDDVLIVADVADNALVVVHSGTNGIDLPPVLLGTCPVKSVEGPA